MPQHTTTRLIALHTTDMTVPFAWSLWVTLAIENVDFMLLFANPSILFDFREAIRQSLQGLTRPGIRAENVTLQPSKGAVFARATLAPDVQTSIHTVRARLGSQGSMPAAVKKALEGVGSIGIVCTAPLSVSVISISLDAATITLTTTKTATPTSTIITTPTSTTTSVTVTTATETTTTTTTGHRGAVSDVEFATLGEPGGLGGSAGGGGLDGGLGVAFAFTVHHLDYHALLQDKRLLAAVTAALKGSILAIAESSSSTISADDVAMDLAAGSLVVRVRIATRNQEVASLLQLGFFAYLGDEVTAKLTSLDGIEAVATGQITVGRVLFLGLGWVGSDAEGSSEALGAAPLDAAPLGGGRGSNTARGKKDHGKNGDGHRHAGNLAGTASEGCYIVECGCPKAFQHQWCIDDSKVPTDWCQASRQNCESSCGIWCSSANATTAATRAGAPKSSRHEVGRARPSSSDSVEMWFVVRNVDFAALTSHHMLLGMFKTRLRQAIALVAQHDVDPDNIALLLSAGSVSVHAIITPPEGIMLDAVSSTLGEPSTFGGVAAVLLEGIQGFDAICLGVVNIDSVFVPKAAHAGVPTITTTETTSKTTTLTGTTTTTRTTTQTRTQTSTTTTSVTSTRTTTTTSKTATSTTTTVTSTSMSQTTTSTSKTSTLTTTTVTTTETTTWTRTTTTIAAPTTKRTSTTSTDVFDGHAEVVAGGGGEAGAGGAGGATTTAPTSKAGDVAGVVLLSVQIHNLDYASLAARPSMLRELRAGAQEVIAATAGADVQAKGIQVALAPGSVVLRAVLPPKSSEASAAAALLTLLQPRLEQLKSAISLKVAKLQGLDDIATGTVFVGNANLHGGAATDASAFLAGGAAAVAQAAPTPWYIIAGRVVLALFLLCCGVPICTGLMRGCCGGAAAGGRDQLRASEQGWKRPDAWYNPVMVADAPNPLLPRGYEEGFFDTPSAGGGLGMGDLPRSSGTRSPLSGPVHSWNASQFASQPRGGEAFGQQQPSGVPSRYWREPELFDSGISSGHSEERPPTRLVSNGSLGAPASADLLGIYSSLQDPLPPHLRPRVVEIERSTAPSYFPMGASYDSRSGMSYAPSTINYDGVPWTGPGRSSSFVAAPLPTATSLAASEPLAGGLSRLGGPCAAHWTPSAPLSGTAPPGTNSVVERMLLRSAGSGSGMQPLPPPPMGTVSRPGQGQTSEVVHAMLGGQMSAQW